eukprot:CAMPEP_0201922460 /NCGR_PEP_ID=MMETSP0903-20130614/10491_1 /ASSEMBLY_ACC=CAM_ASM_000552 /TAXON_ID=420261 /ORGANISM="Thalassiosira antarctica, Strain CCMP982" /LENGTH=395 /DNA_ID=CAMNT_0048459605 /DNA_START=52 /DNA_END=1239 /DNA_ORIENTATION=-
MGKGYDSNFLGSTVPAVPLPSFSKSLEQDVLERETLSNNSEGRRIYRNYHNYTIVMSKSHRTALFAALNVDQSKLHQTDKTAGWRVDDAVGSENQLNDDYYRSNVWDKGHLAPDAAAGWGDSEEDRIAATNDTYFYTNATLQHQNFNRDEWKDLETIVRSWPQDGETSRLSEITGPLFVGTDTIQPEGRDVATIPAGFFKVVAYVSSGSGGKLESSLQVRCFVMYQDAASLEDLGGVVDHQRYQVSVSKIEQLTGLVFPPVYHEANVGFSNSVPQQISDGDEGIFIAAAMVNPIGKDRGNEWISILNRTGKTMSFIGWRLIDQKGRELVLSSSSLGVEESEPGVTMIVQSISPIRLVNTGGSLTLFNEAGEYVDDVSYTKDQVREGVAVDLLDRS